MGKYNSKPIDVNTVTKTSKLTGKTVQYEENVYDVLTVQKEKDYTARKDEFNIIRDTYFGSYYSHFFTKLKSVDIPCQMKTRFLYLCSYMNYEDCFLVDDKSTHKNKLTKKEIASILKLGKSEFAETISILLENKLIIECNGGYIINNEYAIKGEVGKSKDNIGNYTRVFDQGIRELYNQCSAKQHRRLYCLFALLPYINLKYNVVTVSDVSEENYEEVVAMNMKGVCDLVGYDKTKSKRLEKELLQLKIGGKDVIAITKRSAGSVIKVNPAIYYAGTTNQVNELKILMADFGYMVS
ncbi:hypothetical protein PBV87_11595 [Niameybacter massiliensis]|uniref:Uncharacterized protein n=1 Tax=Holtiella tumoricola TaxID=3018743 RepID=A0AA42DMV8_9FIRM|nr:hypothetical protein [Holtiella tumoricola]MDA3732127.1 hypothetical protein [Holtiella tumoricola]